MIAIREAAEHDVEPIREVFHSAYGEHYAHPEFYDPDALKKLIYDDDALILVAEDEETGRLLGTGAVILDLGAYVPAMTFHRVERLDAVRMVRLLCPLEVEDVQLHDTSGPVADLVVALFRKHALLPRLAQSLPGTPLFQGLSPEQTECLAGICTLAAFEPGEAITRAGADDGQAYLLLSGSASVAISPGSEPVGSVGPGETLGEFSLLRSTAHAAGATATAGVEAAVIAREPLEQLIRRRPDIGLVLYRNFASQLGEKLLQADEQVAR